jgi:MoaA/NifB/PqqE/SkfB family radical SAM enzyme
MRVRWFLTNACNLRCVQCGISQPTQTPEIVNSPTAVRAHEIIDELAAAGVKVVEFLGGEPLLVPNFADLVRHCRGAGLQAWLITNGYLIDQAEADRLVDAGLALVIVSIDGSGPASHDRTRGRRGSFDRACAAVRYLDAARKRNSSPLRIFIDSILMSSNLSDVQSSLQMASDLGADRIAFLNLLSSDRLTSTQFGRGLPISVEDYWGAFHRIAASVPKGLAVSLPAPPRVTEYLRETYGVQLESTLEGPTACGLSHFDLHHDGDLYPCGQGEDIFFHQLAGAEPERWAQVRQSVNVNQVGFLGALFSDAYSAFLARAHDKTARRASLPAICTGCRFGPTGSDPRCVPACPVATSSPEVVGRKLAPMLCADLERRIARRGTQDAGSTD